MDIPFKHWRTNITVEYDRLRRWYEAFAEIVPPHRYNREDDEYQTHESFGLGAYGWQLYEADLDGAVEISDGLALDSPLIAKRAKYRFPNGEERTVRNQDYTVRSQLCTGYIATVLDQFPEAYRCGMKVMRAGFKYKVHVDPPRHRHYRAHLTIYTNNKSGHEVLGEEFHMAADGHVWFINSGVEHSAWNFGKTDRVHIYWQMPIETFEKYKDVRIQI